MKTVSLSGSPRESVGKKDAKKHRREGKVPCVIYGGKEQIHFTLEEKDFSRIIFMLFEYLPLSSLAKYTPDGRSPESQTTACSPDGCRPSDSTANFCPSRLYTASSISTVSDNVNSMVVTALNGLG